MQISLERFVTSQVWVWGLPLVVAGLVAYLPASIIERLAAGILAAGGLALVVRAPGPALLVLVALLPFQQIAFALLYRFGVDGGILRPAGGWKEVVVVGIAIAGFHAAVVHPRRTDLLDRLAVGYLVVVTAYLLLPRLLAGAGAPTDLNARLLAYRASAAFVVLFLGARHARLGDIATRLSRVLLVVGVLLSVVAVYEFAFSAAWNDFVVNVAQVPRFKAEVLGIVSENPFDVRIFGTVGDRKFARAGSVLFGSGGLAFYLLIPLALALHRIAQRQASAGVYAAAGLMSVAVLFTITRSAVLSALIMALVLLGPVRRAGGPSRVQFALAVAVAVVLAAPVAAGTGLAERTTSAIEGSESSTQDHITSLQGSVTALARNPLGRGLGTSPGEGERFQSSRAVTSENAYLEVGNELGALSMALYVGLLVAAIRALRRASTSSPSGYPLAEWLRVAAIGLAVGGLFLHIWNFENSLTFWAGAGLALPAAVTAGAAAGRR